MITRLYITAALLMALVTLAHTAQAVEKTAVDQRLNAPMDVNLQSMQTFLSTLTGRIEKDLGNKVTEMETNITTYNALITRLENRVAVLNNTIYTTYNACPHALVNVPSSGGYNTTTSRLVWRPGSNAWATDPLQSWEHN